MVGRPLRASTSPTTAASSRIADAIATSSAAFPGALEFRRALIALEGGLSEIERPDRVLLTASPFFEHTQPYPGRIADYPPGVRENGGQYSHGATWIVDGFVKLAEEARDRGDAHAARQLAARAFEIFEKISPLKKTDPDRIATYGLIPIQQPADIYDGYGHGGRGGWSWYTGSAARMMSAAYALLGVSMVDGQVQRRATTCSSRRAGWWSNSLRVGERVWTRGKDAL